MVKNRAASVAQKGRGFTVAASPFNPVKFELGVVLLIGVVVFAFLLKAVHDETTRFLILAGYSCAGAFWLALRVRRVYRQLQSVGTGNRQSP